MSGKLGLPDGENNKTEPGQLRSRLLKQLGSGKLGLPDGEKSKKVLGELKNQLRSGLGLPNGKSKTELGGHGEVKKLIVGTNGLQQITPPSSAAGCHQPHKSGQYCEHISSSLLADLVTVYHNSGNFRW